MGTAGIIIKTYNNGQGVKIGYKPEEISPYTVVGALRNLIQKIESANHKNEVVE